MTPKEIQILELIKGKLRRGDIQTIADSLHFSRQYVSRCLSTTQDEYSETVVEAATLVIEERKSQRRSQFKTIKKISR